MVGETYQAFMERVVPAVQALVPEANADKVQEMCNAGWAANVMKHATKATITIERDFEFYNSDVYMEGYYDDWRITEVHAVTAPEIKVEYVSTKMAGVGSGDVFKLAKSKPDEQLVFGWANIALDTTGEYPIDWDGDITTPESLEKAAYNFVLKHRATGEMHQGEAVGELVESMMFTKEKQEALGIPEGVIPQGWWVGFHIPDQDVFQKIKSGEYEMFSVEGTAKRKPTES